MRITYLINQYPAVSHSFIRREIRQIEALAGDRVSRVSIRSAPKDLPDEMDKAERELTTSLLGQGMKALLGAALLILVHRPGRFAKGLALAIAMAGWDPRRVLRHLAYFAEAAWLAQYLHRTEAEHLHAHFGTNPAAVARIAHHLSGIPYSFTVHGPEEFDSPLALDLPGKVADAKTAVAISSFGKSQLMRWSDPAHWHKIFVVRCGVDAAFLEAPSTTPPAGPILCCVARLSGQKGLPVLIQACSVLKARGVEFTVTLVGDGEMLEQLEAEVERLGLSEQVLFAGACDADTVRSYLRASRALVLPSFAEGLPVVLMEALALERPVIATRIAGIPELVDDRCGWLIPAGSVEALAEAMADALRAPVNRLAEFGAVGRDRVRAMHSAERNAAQLLEIIRTGAEGAS